LDLNGNDSITVSDFDKRMFSEALLKSNLRPKRKNPLQQRVSENGHIPTRTGDPHDVKDDLNTVNTLTGMVYKVI